MNFLVIFLPFCDFVHVQSVTDLFAKQLNVNVHKKRGKITKKGRQAGDFPQRPILDGHHGYTGIFPNCIFQCTLLAHLLNWEKVVRLTAPGFIKSHKCNHCNYASSHASTLRTHLKIHSGEKSNKCNQCDYTSSRADVLRTHLKRHRGEKSNKGNQCDFAFSYASALRTHLKNEHW